jgi:hypothetical protein
MTVSSGTVAAEVSAPLEKILFSFRRKVRIAYGSNLKYRYLISNLQAFISFVGIFARR